MVETTPRPVGRTLRLLVTMVVSVAAALIVSATPSSAHNNGAHSNRAGFTGDFGPYAVSTKVQYVHDRDPVGVRFELDLRSRNSRSPITDAAVHITAYNDQRTVGPHEADRVDNLYSVVIPDTDAQRWELQIDIDAPRGQATITGTILGAETLNSGSPDAAPGGQPATDPWIPVVVAVAVAIAAVGFTRFWKPVMWIAAAALVLACGVSFVGTWADSTAPAIAKVGSLLLPLLAAAALGTGLLMQKKRDDDGLLLVFVGASGLMVLFGWFNHTVLTGTEINRTYSLSTTRATVSTVLALGCGLMLLVVVLYRTKLRALVSPPPAGRTANRSPTESI